MRRVAAVAVRARGAAVALAWGAVAALACGAVAACAGGPECRLSSDCRYGTYCARFCNDGICPTGCSCQAVGTTADGLALQACAP